MVQEANVRPYNGLTAEGNRRRPLAPGTGRSPHRVVHTVVATLGSQLVKELCLEKIRLEKADSNCRNARGCRLDSDDPTQEIPPSAPSYPP